MPEDNVSQRSSMQGVDWTDKDSIRASSAQVHARFTAKEK
jgi:hypothetical protein